MKCRLSVTGLAVATLSRLSGINRHEMPVTPVTPVKQITGLHEYCISRLLTHKALSILLVAA
jgi:hypothetical protein